MVPICLLLLLATGYCVPDQSKPYTPKPGSSERKAILDTLRKPVEKEMKQKVVFYDVTLRVKNGWAYVEAYGRDTKGRSLKRWAPEVDPQTVALLRKKGKSWTVLYWGATTDESAHIECRKLNPKAPRSLFRSTPEEFPGDGQRTSTNIFNNKD